MSVTPAPTTPAALAPDALTIYLQKVDKEIDDAYKEINANQEFEEDTGWRSFHKYRASDA